MGEEEEEISGLRTGAFEEGARTHDGEPEKSENQFIGKSQKELIELIELARRTLVNFSGNIPKYLTVSWQMHSVLLNLQMLPEGKNAWKYI